MATMATYRGVEPVTVLNGPTAATFIPRGSRVVIVPGDGTNAVALAGASVRGDYVTHQDIATGYTGAADRLGGGAEVVALLATGITVANGDPIYSAANGQVTNVSTNAVYLGKAREPAVGPVLFGVLLETVA